jgi:hypothetical protein
VTDSDSTGNLERVEHGVDCPCARCRGLEPGNEWRFGEGNGAAVTHGGESEARVRPRAELYLHRLRAAAPTGGDPADGIALERLARLLARAELIEDWLDENGWIRDDGSLQSAASQLGTVDNSIRKLLDALGLTSMSRASLRLELLRGDMIAAAEVQARMKELFRRLAEMCPEQREEVFRLGVEASGELVAGELVDVTDEPAVDQAAAGGTVSDG